MFARSRLRSQKPRYAQGVRGLIVLATFLGLLLTAMSGAAQACSLGKSTAADESPPAVTASIELKADAQSVVVIASFFLSKIDIACGGCCGDAHHSNGGDCASGSCFACSAALPGPAESVAIDERTVGYILSRQAPLIFASPDSQFRPPRQFA